MSKPQMRKSAEAATVAWMLGLAFCFELKQNAYLSLAKRPRDLLLQRFEQVLQRAALVGLDEDLDRHAGKEMDIPQAGDLLGRQHDADRVIGLRRLRGVL